jgi:SAM-dependent methyltransferase
MKRLSLRKLFFFLRNSEAVDKCPLCQNPDYKFFYYTIVQSIPCFLVRCSLCSFVFLARRILGDRSEYFYNNIYREDRDINNVEQVYERGVRRGSGLKKFLREKNIEVSNSSIGEFGCGYGGLLGALREDGAEVMGYDIDQIAVDFGRTKGLDLFHADEWLGHTKRFDLIVLSHVVEHIYDLDHFVESVKKRIKPDGIIFIEVPGIQSPKVKSRKYSAQVGHLHYFDKVTLTMLMERHGFRCLYVDDKSLSLWGLER